MKAYLATTALLFALIVVAHIARFIVEGASILQPDFVFATLAAVAMCTWAGYLLAKRGD